MLGWLGMLCTIKGHPRRSCTRSGVQHTMRCKQQRNLRWKPSDGGHASKQRPVEINNPSREESARSDGLFRPTLEGWRRSSPSGASRCCSLLPSPSADARSSGDVIPLLRPIPATASIAAITTTAAATPCAATAAAAAAAVAEGGPTVEAGISPPKRRATWLRR